MVNLEQVLGSMAAEEVRVTVAIHEPKGANSRGTPGMGLRKL